MFTMKTILVSPFIGKELRMILFFVIHYGQETSIFTSSLKMKKPINGFLMLKIQTNFVCIGME